MAAKSEGERGIAMVLAALLLVAIIAISGIAVEVSRLTDTATEVRRCRGPGGGSEQDQRGDRR